MLSQFQTIVKNAMKEKFNQTKYITEYSKEHYSRISTKLPKKLVSDFKEACKKNNVSMNNCIKKLIEDYLKQ